MDESEKSALRQLICWHISTLLNSFKTGTEEAAMVVEELEKPENLEYLNELREKRRIYEREKNKTLGSNSIDHVIAYNNLQTYIVNLQGLFSVRRNNGKTRNNQ